MTSVSYAVPPLDEPVSPELALVDPELAARLRALMPVPDIELEPRTSNVRHLRLTPPPIEEPAAAPNEAAVAAAPVPPSRGTMRNVVAAFVAGAIVATLVTVGVVAELGESELPRESSSVSVPPRVPAPSPKKPKAARSAPQVKTPTKTTPKLKPKSTSKSTSKPKTNTRTTAKKPQNQSSGPETKPRTATRTPAAPAPEPRRFAWAPVEGAVGYRVELFRGDKQVLRATTKDPTFALGAEWRHAGRIERLTPGSYRWYVWPVLRDGAANQAVVQARLSVP